jgi:hypothetical protein
LRRLANLAAVVLLGSAAVAAEPAVPGDHDEQALAAWQKQDESGNAPVCDHNVLDCLESR